jgi:competence protein ComEC
MPCSTPARRDWIWADGGRARDGSPLGLVHTPQGLRDPAVPDRADAMAARGAELELTARSIERIGDDAGLFDRAWRWADAAQARWARTIDQAGGDPIGTAALRGIAVGDRTGVPPALDQRWRATGIYHVLSVSGLHLAVVVAFRSCSGRIGLTVGGRLGARWAAPSPWSRGRYTLVTGALATSR